MIVDRNVFEHPVDELGAASVEATYVGGQPVYDRDA